MAAIEGSSASAFSVAAVVEDVLQQHRSQSRGHIFLLTPAGTTTHFRHPPPELYSDDFHLPLDFYFDVDVFLDPENIPTPLPFNNPKQDSFHHLKRQKPVVDDVAAPTFSAGAGRGSLSAQSVAARQRRRKISEKTRELGNLVPSGARMSTVNISVVQILSAAGNKLPELNGSQPLVLYCNLKCCSQVVPVWLSCLPIKGDLTEDKVVHDRLCSMVERNDLELFCPSNQYLPKIVSVFAEVLCAGKDLATEKTASRTSSTTAATENADAGEPLITAIPKSALVYT